MYEELFEQLVSEMTEAVATKLSEPEELLKDYYADVLNGKLEKSTWGGSEADWRKFWLLTDGTIVPVVDNHMSTAMDAGIVYSSKLFNQGALSGYVCEEVGELGLRGREGEGIGLTFDQIMAVKKLYNEYPIDTVIADMFDEPVSNVSSSQDLSRYLKTGKAKKKKSWESIMESLTFSNKEEIIEALASLEHDQWMDWAKALLKEENISEERAMRWWSCFVPYSQLTEDEKESDRDYARKIIKLLEKK